MSLPSVPGYGLQPPTAHEPIASLARALGSEEGQRIWKEACSSARVRVNGAALTLDQLEAVAESLKGLGGFAGVVGNGLAVRLRTYQILSRQSS